MHTFMAHFLQASMSVAPWPALLCRDLCAEHDLKTSLEAAALSASRAEPVLMPRSG
jgi:hypothetical protein